MEKILKYSKFLKIFFWMSLGFVIITPIVMWALYPSPEIIRKSMMVFDFTPTVIPDGIKILYPMTWSIKILGLMADMIPTVALAYVLFNLAKLFSAFERKHIFEVNNVKIIRSIGYGLIINQILSPISEALVTLIVSWKNPPGHGVIKMTLGPANFGIIILAIITLVIAWIFLEAVKLRKENQQFV